jgi:hypothetical protein
MGLGYAIFLPILLSSHFMVFLHIYPSTHFVSLSFSFPDRLVAGAALEPMNIRRLFAVSSVYFSPAMCLV